MFVHTEKRDRSDTVLIPADSDADVLKRDRSDRQALYRLRVEGSSLDANAPRSSETGS